MSVTAMFGVPVDVYNQLDKTCLKGTNFLKSIGYTKELENKKITNGCSHKINRKVNKFCPRCGKPTTIVNEPWVYSELVGEVSSEVSEKTGLNFAWIDRVGWVLGVYIFQGIGWEEVEKNVKKAIPKLQKLFPQDKPSFYFS